MFEEESIESLLHGYVWVRLKGMQDSESWSTVNLLTWYGVELMRGTLR
jgi:hypothetical protein